MPVTHRQTTEEILDRARAEHATLLEQLSPALRASLPVDAVGITQAIDHLGEVVGISARLRDAQKRGHHANPAVLHGRVFGRTPLTRATVLAAFVEGARVRAGALEQLAVAAGGEPLEIAVRDLPAGHPLELGVADEVGESELRSAYAAQEQAVLLVAAHLDDEEA